MENNNHPKFLLGALVGGAIGVVTALLLTPASGVQVRRRITRKLNPSFLHSVKTSHAKAKKIIKRRKTVAKKHK